MNLSFSEEQEELRTLVRDFLAEKSPESEVRRLMVSVEGFDPAVWTQLAEELGLCGLAIPEEYGGAGYSFTEVGVVLQELGRALACLPYLSSVLLAQSLLLNAGDDAAAREFLPSLAAGSLRATVAVAEQDGRLDPEAISTLAEPDGGDWKLSGSKSYVIDGNTADLIFVAARTDAGISLFAVESTAPGLTRQALPTLDQTRKQARLDFAATPARLIGDDGGGWPVLSKTLDLAAAGLSAECVGGAQRVLEMSVDYAKTRHQFGRPIGSFQAIKHRCADMLIQVESSKSAMGYALWAASEAESELSIAAGIAKSYCPDSYYSVASESIQIYGGIGFTWEHPAHLYFKRAKSSQLLFGDSAHHRTLLASSIDI